MRWSAAIYPLIAVVAALLSLNGRGTWGALASQTGFISIDCGASEPYLDPVTGISWVTDANYTSLGKSVANVPAGSLGSSFNTELSTLRYFEPGRQKYCYVMPVTSNTTYLIRARFWYGNYDKLNKPPTFNIAIDSSQVVGVNTSITVAPKKHEYVYRTRVTSTSISFCLYPDDTAAVPFISSLELRPLATEAYDQPLVLEGGFLFLFTRRNYGGNRTIRYPDDEYDRIWEPWVEPTLVNIATTLPIVDNFYYLRPPPAVMQTAQTSATLENVVFPFKSGLDPTYSYPSVLILYFAELSDKSNASSRIFTTKVLEYPDKVRNIFNFSEGPLRPAIFGWDNFTLTASSQVTLVPIVPPSVDPPLLNGAELYVRWEAESFPTADTDVAAIEAIKVALKLTSWGGDPCLPVPYDWITCSTSSSSPRRVVGVKLSKYNLTGEIPSEFAKLTALTTLWLDNNALTGSIPNLIMLTSLVSLHLQRNSLSGSIPDTLGSIPTLKELFLQNNKLVGTLPANLQNKPGLVLDIRGNPVCNCGPSTEGDASSSKESSNVGLIAGVIGGVVAVLLLGCLLGFFFVYKRRRAVSGNKFSVETLPMKKEQYNYVATGDDNVSNQGAKPYSIAEISAATQKFNKKIGEGGFGPVYYGKLATGKEVAVKVSDLNSRQGAHEFNNEVQLLSRVHHKNLVSLLGFCQVDKSQMLIYEFLHKGTVREHLYGSPLAIEEPLDWRMRLDIALNAAQGLEYLHTGCSPSIIHRDIKSSNILLTDKYVAKVADFGLSKLAPEEGATHVSTMVKGTAGYLDPEYWSTNNLTEKSDVFSFGVVLLEILCARMPIDNTLPDRNKWNINDWVRSGLQAGDIESILDPAIIKCHPNMGSVWKVAELAIQSVEPRGAHRPYMRDVVCELREAITLELGHSVAYSDQSTNSSNNQRGTRHTPQPSNTRANEDYKNSGNPQRGQTDDFSGVSTNSSMYFDNYDMAPQVR